MYSTSSQKHHWTFSDSEQLRGIRQKANHRFRHKYAAVMPAEDDPSVSADCFLTAEQEANICQMVAETAFRFSQSFKPRMPSSVVWTAFTYYRRFYLKYSAMEYSPKRIIQACFYLACKVDEFNVSVDEFVANLQSGSREGNVENVLSFEPVVMAKLDYHLTVHGPFRALEGHFIDLKTRWPDPQFGSYETLREEADSFLQRALFSDALLLYSPSQIAFAALYHAADKQNASLDNYIDECMVSVGETASLFRDRLRSIVTLVNAASSGVGGDSDDVKVLLAKASEWSSAQLILDQRLKDAKLAASSGALQPSDASAS